MALSSLGDYIAQVDVRNESARFCLLDVKGISTSKAFIDTKADLEDVNLAKYKIVELGQFAYVADTSRRGEKLALAFADKGPCIVSNIYTVFKVKDERKLLPRYLMMFFNRPEFDRYARFHSWGSARETFDWETLCNTRIEIPPIAVQRKYVAIYESSLANLSAYEKGLSDLKLTCDAYVEELRKRIGTKAIGPYLVEIDERNRDLSVKLAMGVDNKKTFVSPKQVARTKRDAKIVRRGYFAYNRATTRNGEKISIAYRDDEDCVVSSAYCVFKISNESVLNPKYLMIWFRRSEFDRYARFMSKGSAHEFFEFSDMKEVKIPLPDISTQNEIVSIYESIEKRICILAKMKTLTQQLCPLLVRGAVSETHQGRS